MARRSRVAFVAICIVAALSAKTSAAADSVFGPNIYSTAAGKSQTFEETFAVDIADDCDGRADYVLVVENNGVSSARVSLNGTDVVRESDFAPNRTSIERAVAVAASNRMVVVLNGGKPSATLRLSIRREIDENVAPPLTFTLTANHGTFTASVPIADAAGNFVVVLRNGTNGAGRVKGRSIFVNDVEVIGATDLDSDVAVIRKPVVVAQANTIRAVLDGRAGDIVEVSIRRVLDASVCKPRIAIESPSGTVVAAQLFVTGTTSGSRDIGVSVNGVAADLDLVHAGTLVDPYRWIVRLDAEAGPLTIVAKVATFAGQTAEDRRDVVFTPEEGAPVLGARPSPAVAPATIAFSFDPAPSDVNAVSADFDDDGVFEFNAASLASLAKTYDTPGLRHVSVRVETPSGTISADTWVNVVAFGTLDTLLKQRWAAFRAALAAKDLAAANAILAGEQAKEKYGLIFARLMDRLPAIAASMDPILPVYIQPDFAKYLLTRVEDGVEHGYYVYFIRDADGLWRVAQF